MLKQRSVALSAVAGTGIVAVMLWSGSWAQRRTATTLTGDSQDTVDGRATELSREVTVLRQQNVELTQRLTDLESQLSQLEHLLLAQPIQVSFGSSEGAVEVVPAGWSGLEEALGNWEEFRAKVLTVVKPELDPIASEVAALSQHHHELEMPATAWGTLGVVQNSSGALIPYVPPHNQGHSALKTTSGPQ